MGIGTSISRDFETYDTVGQRLIIFGFTPASISDLDCSLPQDRAQPETNEFPERSNGSVQQYHV